MRDSPVKAVSDACFMYPVPLRDFLMWPAAYGSFRARWTSLIDAIHNAEKHTPINADTRRLNFPKGLHFRVTLLTYPGHWSFVLSA